MLKILPMVKITLTQNEEVDISENTKLDKTAFASLCKALHSYELDSILEVAYHIRGNYSQSCHLLEMAEEKSRSNSQQNHVKIQRIGLMIQHKMNVRSLMEEFRDSTDRRIDFLKGVFFLNNGQLEDAQFCFERASYKKGLDRCAVMKNDRSSMATSTDPVVRCYYSSRNWKSFNSFNGFNGSSFNYPIDNADFLYIIGKSTVFDHKENIDVQIREIEQEIDNWNPNKSNNLVGRLKQLIDGGVNSPQVLYDLGKIYHLLKDHENATLWYERVLGLDRNYLPAKFNLARIKNTPVEDRHKYPDVQNYNVIYSLKNLIFDVDIYNCDDWVKNLYHTIHRSRNLNKAVLGGIESISRYINSVVFGNNKAILMENDESILILGDLLKTADSQYSDFIRYNLGILKRDIKLLEESKLPEARVYFDYFTKNANTTDIKLKAYLLDDRSLLQGENDSFCAIFIGNKLLDEYIASTPRNIALLEEAEVLFRSYADFPLCINGLGICAALGGNYSAAVKLFSQITVEYPPALKNLAFCYLLQKKYGKAVECLLKNENIEFSKKDENVLLYLVDQARDLRLVDMLIEKGFTSLKKTKALLLLHKGELEKAIDLGVQDSEVSQKIDLLKMKEEARKRKIEELEEYRKKRAFQ